MKKSIVVAALITILTTLFAVAAIASGPDPNDLKDPLNLEGKAWSVKDWDVKTTPGGRAVMSYNFKVDKIEFDKKGRAFAMGEFKAEETLHKSEPARTSPFRSKIEGLGDKGGKLLRISFRTTRGDDLNVELLADGNMKLFSTFAGEVPLTLVE